MTELTKQNIYDWLGSDNTEAQAVEIIQELVNGDYSIEALKSDILEYQDNEDLNTQTPKNWKDMLTDDELFHLNDFNILSVDQLKEDVETTRLEAITHDDICQTCETIAKKLNLTIGAKHARLQQRH